MIIVQLNGGLGNQMFQYAAGKALSLKYGVALKLDITHFSKRESWGDHTVFRDYDLTIFNIEEKIATKREIDRFTRRVTNDLVNRLLNKIFGLKKTYLKQPYFHYYPGIVDYGKDLYLEGYWQTEKYFKEYEANIRQEFTFKKPLGEKAELLGARIRNTHSVCVNVRRGDFTVTTFHGTMGADYYATACKIINGKINDPHYFVFSDDMGWCRDNLVLPGPVTFVGHEYAGEKFQEYFQLMIHCKHFIIPNSSFGWWAAWLNSNPDKIVIAPEKWFHDGPKDTQDIIPEGWLKI